MPSWIPFHLVTAAPYDALRGVPVVPAAHLWSRAGGEVLGHDVLPAKRSCVAGRLAGGGVPGGGGGVSVCLRGVAHPLARLPAGGRPPRGVCCGGVARASLGGARHRGAPG